METFCTTENVVGFPKADFSLFKKLDGSKMINKNLFSKNICHELAKLSEKIESHFKQVTEESAKTINIEQFPYRQAFAEIWGCNERCPFCAEYCRFSENHLIDEISHACIQHKPAGLNGTYIQEPNRLAIENCGADIQSQSEFNCSKVCAKAGKCTTIQCPVWHKYFDFKKYFPSWDILPEDVEDSAPFWGFLFNKYETELIEYWEQRYGKFKTERPKIPKAWTKISEQDAKDSLRKLKSSKGQQ